MRERSDTLSQGLLDAAPDAMVGVDGEGVIVVANRQAERLFGYRRDELVGSPIEMLLPDAAARRHARLREQYLADPVPRPMGARPDLAGRRKDGSEFLAEISLSAVRTEDGLMVAAAIRDGAERRRSAIVASSSDAIVGRDIHGRINSWNAGAERMYGYGAAEAIGGELREMLPPGRPDEVTELIARVHQGGSFEHHETKRVRKDGRTIDVSVTISPVRDPLGTIIGSSAVGRDISESKRALEALAASEARKSAIVESSMDCIISMDHQGLVVEFNPAAEATFGYSRAQAIGRSLGDLIVPPAQRADHVAGFQHYLASGEGPILDRRLELTAQRRDGTEFPVELVVRRFNLEGPPLFIGFLRDISEHRQVQAALAEMERLLEAVLDHSPAIINVQDIAGNYLFVNQAFAEAAGIELSAVRGLSHFDLMFSDDPDQPCEEHQEVVRTGRPIQSETVATRPAGPRHYLTVRFPVYDAAGTVYAVGMIGTDITDGRAMRMERERLGARRRQSERLESLGQLAGGVAHDFNNLLGAILNYVAIVSAETTGDPVVHADVQKIGAAAESAARLTRQLLIVGRREPIRPQTFEIDDVIAGMRDLLARSIGEQIRLLYRPGHDVPPVRADRGQMEQILLNLTVNARDAMPGGGRLTIATRVVEVDDAQTRLRPEMSPGLHVELTVGDTGVGMTPEVVERIFEPFYTTKPRGEGSGLGLATVYGIVSEAGGDVTVYSEPGIGTVFRLIFPAAGPVESPGSPSRSDPAAGAGQTVLVVDDSALVRESTARILSTHGYVVLEAGSGREALEIAGMRPLDLLLTDVVMPEMPGPELATRIAEVAPGLPVAFMSGFSEGVMGTGGVLADRAPLLEKPFSEAQLLAVVGELLVEPERGEGVPLE